MHQKWLVGGTPDCEYIDVFRVLLMLTYFKPSENIMLANSIVHIY